MRAPQYGVDKYKARCRGRLNDLAPHQAKYRPHVVTQPRDRFAPTKPNAAPEQRMIRHKLPAPFVDRMKVSRSVGISGANAPLPTHRIRYMPPKRVSYSDNTVGAACTMSLHHKNAGQNIKARKRAFGDQHERGPTATKRYAVLENTHRGPGFSS